MSVNDDIRNRNTDPLDAAADAVRELSEALAAHGITLPSLGTDLASCTSTLTPRPLVELGRYNLDTARRLARALKGDAAR
ncbi:hypothetical protein [Streptomyces sp. SYSU K217416]